MMIFLLAYVLLLALSSAVFAYSVITAADDPYLDLPSPSQFLPSPSQGRGAGGEGRSGGEGLSHQE